MNPYPLYYCPEGVNPPPHCPFPHGLRVTDGAGPDGGTGLVFGPGGDLATGLDWQPTTGAGGGWWFAMGNQRPQDLIRLHTSPRIQRWHALPGIEKGHAWRVPVLLTPMDAAHPEHGYVSALDRIWRGGSYGTPEDLKACQVALLKVAHHVELGESIDERNASLADLCVAIVAQAHHVSRHEIVHKGWFSEELITAIPLLALDRLDLALSKADA